MLSPWRSVALLLCLLIVTTSAWSAAVLQLDMDRLLLDSEFVFEGEVSASRAEWSPAQGAILTKVTFRIDDVIKGEYSASTIELSFNGGTIGQLTLQIAGMIYPQPGDRGIYFVESLSRQQVNPLLGWSQGHFRIRPDRTISTERGQPVLGLAPKLNQSVGGFSRNSQVTSRHLLTDGHAHGLKLGQQGATGQRKEDFKAELRQRIQRLSAEVN